MWGERCPPEVQLASFKSIRKKSKSSFITGDRARCSSSWNFSHQRQCLGIMQSFPCFRLRWQLLVAACCGFDPMPSSQQSQKWKTVVGVGRSKRRFLSPLKIYSTPKPTKPFPKQDIFTGEAIIPFLLEGWEWLPQGKGTAKVINTKHTMTNSDKQQPRTYLAWN